MTNVHNNTTLTLEDLADKVKIVKQIREHRKLSIYEALTILERKPGLNRQIDNFINPLKLFARGHQLNPARLPIVFSQYWQYPASSVSISFEISSDLNLFNFFLYSVIKMTV